MVTLAPLFWLVSATMTASYQKISIPSPALGFLAHARSWPTRSPPVAFLAARWWQTQNLIFNDRLDAAVTLSSRPGLRDSGRVRAKLVALRLGSQARRLERSAHRTLPHHRIARRPTRDRF